ncbi:hypothetical protein KUV75_07210 [Qipengyuania gaetbuli]|uniref:hypothetical protein n=1 Tax=Qipengyuania gaetbuli TaxID=266952 RepID=UPI001C9907F1|nr:hypothetical protein [Qipengyuania gaetbuli]MBY6014687.1 hypothetical protein [Qipengyuania gaetbuli]
MISQFYSASHGANYQPAFQAAIDHAEANSLAAVHNDLGAISMEMWRPVRTTPFGLTNTAQERQDLYAPDGVPLVIRKPLSIDFAGATITLKGSDGGSRWPGQLLANGERWVGGWIYVIGYEGFERIALKNVTVDGMMEGPWTQERRNLSDKGFRVHDTSVKRIELTNVELRNFGGEIYYTGGGNGVEEQIITDCHFHGSPQCAFNPGTVSVVKATRVRAGRSYQAVEAIGGISNDYVDCEFYESGSCSFLGGPKPNFQSNYPYWYPLWDGVGAPPRIDFRGTVFRECGNIWIGAWTTGEVEMRDTELHVFWRLARVHDIKLKVRSIADKGSIHTGVSIGGPQQLGIPVEGAPAGTVYEPVRNIDIDLHCEATADAQAKGFGHKMAFGLVGGIVDASSLRLVASGRAKSIASVYGIRADQFEMPQVLSNGFVEG